MKVQLAERLRRADFQGDFLEMILVAATKPGIISFAGGLPNPASFPVDELAKAAQEVLHEDGVIALQYSTSAGFLPLRRYIAERYAKSGIILDPDDIIITNGSQQALDLVSGALLDDGDVVVVERPCYLAALQVFHLYNPVVRTVELTPEGVAVDELREIIERDKPKFFYSVPNFQNPTGLTYSEAVRHGVAESLRGSDTMILEDNPYGDLRFRGLPGTSFHTLLGEQCLMFGSFSKIVSPGLRIGWIACTNKELREQIVSYKQRVDMHTNIFGQMVLARYLQDCDLEAHIEKIKELYGHQADVMLGAMSRYFPEGTRWTKPD
ncbi:MAG: PLP-dependent aminotransferase family protein, partial [Bilophila sp.]